MRTFYPPGHVGSDTLMKTAQGAASAIDIGHDLHNISVAGAIRQHC